MNRQRRHRPAPGSSPRASVSTDASSCRADRCPPPCRGHPRRRRRRATPAPTRRPGPRAAARPHPLHGSGRHRSRPGTTPLASGFKAVFETLAAIGYKQIEFAGYRQSINAAVAT